MGSSSSLASRDSAAIAHEKQLATIREQITTNPLMAAPESIRHAVWKLWFMTQHILPSAGVIAANFGVWCRDWHLAEDDAAEILREHTSPAKAAGFKFHADLMTSLANAAGKAIERRMQIAEQLERRNADAKVSPEERAEARRVIRNLLSQPTE